MFTQTLSGNNRKFDILVNKCVLDFYIYFQYIFFITKNLFIK